MLRNISRGSYAYNAGEIAGTPTLKILIKEASLLLLLVPSAFDLFIVLRKR